MKQIFTKITLLNLFIVFSCSVFAMEKDETKVQSLFDSELIARSKELLQSYRNNHKISTNNLHKIQLLIDRMTTNINLLYSLNLQELINFDHEMVDLINQIETIFLAHFDQQQFFNIYISLFSELSIKIYYAIKSTMNRDVDINYITFGDLYRKSLKLFLDQNIDLFDSLFEHLKDDNLKEFENQVLSKFVKPESLASNIYNLLIDKGHNSTEFTALINTYYHNLTDANHLLNEKIDTISYISISLLEVIMDSMTMHLIRNESEPKKLLLKLINEPTIYINTWLKTINSFNITVERSSMLKDLNVLPVSAEGINFLNTLIITLKQAISWKQEQIKILRDKLLDAIKKEDLKLTNKFAHELYTITRNFEDDHGNTPLHTAVFHKQNIEIVKILISIYPGLMFAANNEGKTPMHMAAGAGEYMLQLMMDMVYQIKHMDINHKLNLLTK